MGYMRHHAIIVTTWDQKRARKARDRAAGVFGGRLVSKILPAAVNEFWTFIVGPDGSKEGWDESEAGDAKRDEYIAWLNSQRYEDGSSPYAWAEVQYGDEEGADFIRRTDRSTRPPSTEE
jgi:hypothetical protein